MTTVLTFGTFDIFHPGHEYYLREAKKHGDRLVTIIARDQTVTKLKWKQPKHNETQRKQTVEKSGIPDRVELWKLQDYYSCITDHKADVVCLGYDQSHLANWLQKFLTQHQLEVKVTRLAPFQEHIYKSSKLG